MIQTLRSSKPVFDRNLLCNSEDDFSSSINLLKYLRTLANSEIIRLAVFASSYIYKKNKLVKWFTNILTWILIVVKCSLKLWTSNRPINDQFHERIEGQLKHIFSWKMMIVLTLKTSVAYWYVQEVASLALIFIVCQFLLSFDSLNWSCTEVPRYFTLFSAMVLFPFDCVNNRNTIDAAPFFLPRIAMIFIQKLIFLPLAPNNCIIGKSFEFVEEKPGTTV